MTGTNGTSGVIGQAQQTSVIGNIVMNSAQFTELISTISQEICDSVAGGNVAGAAGLVEFHNHASCKHTVGGVQIVDITPDK